MDAGKQTEHLNPRIVERRFEVILEHRFRQLLECVTGAGLKLRSDIFDIR